MFGCGLFDDRVSGVIKGDGVHDIWCHHGHMRGSFLPNYSNIVEHHTCRYYLTSPLRRDPQATETVKMELDDPKGCLYPDPAFI